MTRRQIRVALLLYAVVVTTLLGSAWRAAQTQPSPPFKWTAREYAPIESEVCVGGVMHHPLALTIRAAHAPVVIRYYDGWRRDDPFTVTPSDDWPVWVYNADTQVEFPIVPRQLPEQVTPGRWSYVGVAVAQGYGPRAYSVPITVVDCEP